MFRLSKVHSLVVLGGLIFLFCACQGKKQNNEPVNVYENDNLYSEDFILEDTVGTDFSGDPYPMGLDGSFDDFVFAYAANKSFQAQRTDFPLLILDNEKNDSVWLSRDEWQPDSLFTNKNFYTILYDKEEDMEIVSQPNLTKAEVEWIYLADKLTKVYHFTKENEIWMLRDITYDHLKEYHNEEFVQFYQKFATDTLFQSSRLADPLEYITSDPNDDFEILETSISHTDWENMRPIMPEGKLMNINYGQINDPASDMKIMAVKGIGTGFSNVFFFRMNEKEKWELFKFDDVGI